jgi:uncharacterized protein
MFKKLSKLVQTILSLEDTEHSIALGTAIGLFVAWTPTVGIHMILVVGLTLLLRANKAAGLIAVYLSNPLTIVPMYWIDYRLGALFLHQELTYTELRMILHYHGWDGFKAAFWKICVELAGPMWLGGLVLAFVHAIPGYYLTRWAVVRFRRRNRGLASCPATVPSGSTEASKQVATHQSTSNSQ